MTTQLTGRELRTLLGPPDPDTALHTWLVERLLVLIADGRLVHGTRLPSERDLVDALGVSRTTVTRAYRSMRERGAARARQGSGTVVQVPQRSSVGGGEPLADSCPQVPGSIDLRSTSQVGPVGLGSAFVAALEELPAFCSGMGYYPAGIDPLRERIAAQFAERGVPTGADQIVVTSGALAAAVAVFDAIAPRQRVLVETPSYPNTVAQLRHSAARPVAIPLGSRDERAFAGAAAMYAIPDFHNPTGALLPDEDRAELAALWRRHDVVGVVDETMAHTWIDRQPKVRPMAAHDPDCVTIGSASKTFWGGLRIGWVRAPRRLVAPIVAARTRLDLGAAVLEQLATCRLLDRQDEILAHARPHWLRQRQVMLGLAEVVPGATTTVPTGGLSLWWRLPAPRSTELVAAAARQGVLLAPGSTYAVDRRGLDSYLRTPFVRDPNSLTRAVEGIGRAWSALGG